MSTSRLNFPLSAVKSETSLYFSTTITLSGLKLLFIPLQTNKRAEDDSISQLRSIIRETVDKHIAGGILDTVPLSSEEAFSQKHLQDPLTLYSITEPKSSLLALYTMTEANGLHSTLVVNCVSNSFLSSTAILLNIITIQALRKTPSLSKPLKTLLLSLAVSDLGVGFLVQPTYVAVLVMKIEQNADNRTYDTIFGAFSMQNFLFVFASFFGVFALTVDRFLAIHLHLRYEELVTHKRVVAVVSSVWVLSALIALLALKWIQVLGFIFATINVVCYVTTGLFYCKIYAVIRHHVNQINVLQQSAQNEDMVNAARLRKTAVATFYVYLVFLVCYLPAFCAGVAKIHGETPLLLLLSEFSYTFVYLNSSLNPLIYCWKMRNIRQTVKNILKSIFPCGT